MRMPFLFSGEGARVASRYPPRAWLGLGSVEDQDTDDTVDNDIHDVDVSTEGTQTDG